MTLDGKSDGRQELRCFCSRSPLLAVYGTDKEGIPYVHVKIYKQGRIYGETFHRGGTVEIRCRECIRWHRIFVQAGRPKLVAVDEPVELQNVVLDNAGDVIQSPV